MDEYIHQSNLIEEVDNLLEDQQSMEAWLYLENQSKITHAVIKKVQKMITINQPLRPDQRGYYRSLSKITPTIANKYPTPPWTLVDALMDNWVYDMGNWKHRDPKEMHIRFEYAHPFVDGNGRTGRMLMWWHEQMLGRTPTLIRDEERQTYYKWFRNKHK